MGSKRATRWSFSVTVALLLTLLAVPMNVAAWSWQGTSTPFGHNDYFSGTVSGGQEDRAVEYEDAPNRLAWAEGAYLTWTQDGINSLQNYAYCAYNPWNPGCSGASYYFGAAVFHAFDKNTHNSNALQNSGWASSNLPGASYAYPHGEEVRVYIGDPNSMSTSGVYFAQTYYVDTAYSGTKTQGEIDYSKYLVQSTSGGIQNPINRDYNTKVCINDDSASGGGGC